MSSNSLKISVSGMFVLLTLQLAASASVIFSLPQQIEKIPKTCSRTIVRCAF